MMNHETKASAHGLQGAREIRRHGLVPLSETQAMAGALQLIADSETVIVGSLDQNGYPQMKAMFKRRAEGIKHVWFSTHASSKRTFCFKYNDKASLYVADSGRMAGLLLTGRMELVHDMDMKQALWMDGWEAYYPLGITDPEYTLLRFTAFSGNYYQGLQNVNFTL
ncbi:pyridoxamine 5'-phosphate oxidase family protein [Paenibacillus sp. SYP-B4298]|uniref:pyridoxamine 5'-phosphate oxidase family protein n=1 Tax=Paenibacillus sp. SYP-B4298 TaxID=2996034 RepID=UPI0022DCF24C|nr:pyridoxamine 5'-phosphate oxidase family protein [Paenibacillus sp. SYP-B4298]